MGVTNHFLTGMILQVEAVAKVSVLATDGFSGKFTKVALSIEDTMSSWNLG